MVNQDDPQFIIVPVEVIGPSKYVSGLLQGRSDYAQSKTLREGEFRDRFAANYVARFAARIPGHPPVAQIGRDQYSRVRG